MTQSVLLVELVLALVAALAGGALAERFGVPALVGYVFAGIAIGPFTPGWTGDVDVVASLADIGIVLLMFTIGLQLSRRDLREVGRTATLGSVVQVLTTMGAVWLLARAVGLGSLEALFFGAVVSNSSSTVMSKVLGERGEIGSEHGRFALAWSSIQDLGTIVLVAVLSAIAEGVGSKPVLSVLVAIAKATLFLVVLFSIGTRLIKYLASIPAVMRQRELFVVGVAACALGTAYLATRFGISLALGAFAAGILIADSHVSEHVLGTVSPLRDVFSGLFFVSIGMLVDPRAVVRSPLLVLTAFASIVLAKGAISLGVSLALGRGMRVAAYSAALLAQSAEFSFVLVGVGRDRGAVATETFQALLAATVLSVVTAPFVYLSARSLVARVRRAPIAPEALKAAPRPGHVLICGYGRVGATVARALQQAKIPWTVIDDGVDQVLTARELGGAAVAGDAANPVVLDLAGVATASVLVVALPDATSVRRVFEHARIASPDVPVIVRTHGEEECEKLRARGALALVGEFELARAIARETLRSAGVAAERVEDLVPREPTISGRGSDRARARDANRDNLLDDASHQRQSSVSLH